MKRRHFVLGTLGAAGALGIGWGLLPVRQRLTSAEPLPAAPGEVPFNGWVKVGRDERVTIVMPRSEMGQGVHTGLAMVLADELDADWAQVRVEPSPIDPIYFNLAVAVDGLPFHPDSSGLVKRVAGRLTAKTMREMGLMVTGGSSTVKDLWLPMRQAGASARGMFVAAAAQAWGVPAGEITVAAGVLMHPSGKRARFGELAEAAARQPLPADPVLKTPPQWRLIGAPLPRLPAEAQAKARGTAGFGIDAMLPGMLHASVAMCPTLGGRAASFKADAATKLPGVKQVVAFEGLAGGTGGVAAVADTPWHAMQAIKAVEIAWDENVPAAGFSSREAIDGYARVLDGDDGFPYLSTGDVDAALKGAAKTINAEYRAPFLAHLTMEPQACAVQVGDGKATVWAPTQVPDAARRHVALALGLSQRDVTVHVQYLGGGFGRRLDVDFIAQAALIAARGGQGAPVLTTWSREEDLRHDFYRPAAVARFQAGLDAQGRVVAWRSTSAGPSPVQASLGRLFGLPAVGPDKTTAEGSFDQPYEWPAARVGHVIVKSPVPVGFWRSVGHSHHAFFKESFVDEAAHAAGQDPVAFRAALLKSHPRHLAVLMKAATMAGWGQPAGGSPDGAKTARGIALHQSFGSIVAQVADVSLGPDKQVRVHRVWCAVDCGTPVNPNLIRQQMESAIVFGLSAALFGGVEIDKGRVKPGNFHEQPVLRIDACPTIIVEILPSSEPPEGVGEPGTPPIAPAVANALFALTGQRLRTLPLQVA